MVGGAVAGPRSLKVEAGDGVVYVICTRLTGRDDEYAGLKTLLKGLGN